MGDSKGEQQDSDNVARPRVLNLRATHPESKNYFGAIPLAILSVLSMKAILSLSPRAPVYVVAPFISTFFGSFLGFLVETFGASVKNFPTIRSIRTGNIGIVLPTMFFMVLTMSSWLQESYGPLVFTVAMVSGMMASHAYLGHYAWLSQMFTYVNLFGIMLGIATISGKRSFLDNHIGVPLANSYSAKLTFRQLFGIGFGLITAAFMAGDLIIAGAFLSRKFFSPVYHSILSLGTFVLWHAVDQPQAIRFWTETSAKIHAQGEISRVFLDMVSLPIAPSTSALSDFQILAQSFVRSVTNLIFPNTLCAVSRVVLNVSDWWVCEHNAVADRILGLNTDLQIGNVFGLYTDLFALALGFCIGSFLIISLIPFNVSQVRYRTVGTMWTLVHRFLLAVPATPPPTLLNRVNDPTDIPFVPYNSQHIFSRPISIPAAARVPLAQQLKWMVLQVVFTIISWLDRFLPMARPTIQPKDKPRVDSSLGIDYYWPTQTLQRDVPMPPKLVTGFNENPGLLLSWTLSYATGTRELYRENSSNKHLFDRAREASGCDEISLMLDLRSMEQYEVKKGWAKYGGLVFFKETPFEVPQTQIPQPGLGFPSLDLSSYNPVELETIVMYRPCDVNQRFPYVVSQLTPKSRKEFLRVEKQVHCSLVALNVIIYHLLEIHAMTSVVATALHNTFDTDVGKPHPLRGALNFHFFNSTEVQELTTAHLLDISAVFPQVFALTHAGLAQFLDDRFFEYEFLKDTDLKERSCTVVTPQVMWELVYKEGVFEPYARRMVDSIWPRGKVDAKMDVLREKLLAGMRIEKLPQRFEELKTKDGVTCLVADLLHLVTVRHEILGTTYPLAILDHRFTGTTQQVLDGSPLPLEEYLSVIQIVASTGMKQFPQFLSMSPPAKELFRTNLRAYMVDGAARNSEVQGDKITEEISDGFEEMVSRLETLHAVWSASGFERYNADRLRVLPGDLEIGAGY